jgi:two-component system sensor histidine kinase UhpB
LYARVVAVNAAVLVTALLLLVLTPVTVSAPVSARQLAILVLMLTIMVFANALLLKISFSGLAALVRRMEILDVLHPRERLPEMGGAETRALISGFNAMLGRLEAERRASTRRSIAALEGERARISRELHDEIGQRLTGILLQLAPIHDEAPADVRAGLVGVQEQARAVLSEIGALAWQIRPGILDDLGLVSALAALASSLRRDGHIRIDASVPHQLPTITDEAELAIYRIAQEALTNAVRHSSAGTIALELRATEAELVLRITDDGYGSYDDGAEGPGLRGMRERALLIGGRLRIHENPPHGWRVELAVPMSGVDRADAGPGACACAGRRRPRPGPGRNSSTARSAS